ncbi:MAG: hypothetical protein E6H04_06785 [Bacillati bacterium ANGP1]|uniref:Uncharacterized protein n=1 Tax=Candidatus Segetimicrobium genomatis TaxID=2569760 RepID=A0A537JDK7_9BACT|nr:MAG: hypothetical protein E6H04_06785 [Terrabacteria group bacterium ANGP1]
MTKHISAFAEEFQKIDVSKTLVRGLSPEQLVDPLLHAGGFEAGGVFRRGEWATDPGDWRTFL